MTVGVYGSAWTPGGWFLQGAADYGAYDLDSVRLASVGPVRAGPRR